MEEDKMTRDEFIKFMSDPDNIMNCDECPMKQENPSWEMPYQCGQQHCWVLLHIQNMKGSL